VKREDRLRLIEASERDLAEADRLTEVLEATTATVLSAVAADTAEGVITADQAAARRAAAAGELTQARERVDALRRGLPELLGRLAQEDARSRRRGRTRRPPHRRRRADCPHRRAGVPRRH
jgi:hypothetical protein